MQQAMHRGLRAPSQATARHAAHSVRSRTYLRVQAGKGTVPATITVTKQLDFGEVMRVVGNQAFLGAWDPTKAPSLQWGDGHTWSTTLQVPVGEDVCFKLISYKDEGGSSNWENGNDRKFKALGPDYGLNISCKWNDTNSTKVKAYNLKDGSAAAPPPPQQQQHSSSRPSNGNNNGNGAPSSPERRAPSGALNSLEEDARSTSAWVGAEPQFVRSRQDKYQRNGVWDTSGLHGLEVDLVRGDEKASNWLGKLGLMKELLVDKPHMMRPGLEELVTCYVYGTWISTGAIACTETGGHHRPNHHAALAAQMFRSLEWVIGEAGSHQAGELGPESRTLAARRLHVRLPSISGEFRVSTPLTRIRDIAHRNDIPQDLKNEIKHTLQNKLHRSAGPEDLVATEAMLARVTAQPGQYPHAFVEEFKIFTRELRDFFNASGLVDLLEAISPALDSSDLGAVSQFRAAMAQLDKSTAQGGGEPLEDLGQALIWGSTVRAVLISKLMGSPLRNDTTDDVLAMRQRFRLAELRIEDFVFVVLSRVIGYLEDNGGASTLARPGGNGHWPKLCMALVYGMRHLALSGYAAKELVMMEKEVQSWLDSYVKTQGGAARKEHSLLGKACAERLQRIATQYSDMVMSVFQQPALRLGPALGVPEHMSRVFAESEVRASVAFQVSRAARLMIKALRAAANMDAWDGLVTGEAAGRLVEVDSLSPEAMKRACAGHEDNVVLLVRQAEGDEEVGPLGRRLAGVVLLQELPHLSHLGVRARQEQVTFATCDDEDHIRNNILPLINRHVQLSVTADGVTLKEGRPTAAAATRSSGRTAVATAPGGGGGSSRSSSGAGGGANGSRSGAGAGGGQQAAGGADGQWSAEQSDGGIVTQKTDSITLVALSAATVRTCGAKAAKCGELERLEGAGALFRTPAGAALPFGCMELALQHAGVNVWTEYQSCLAELEAADLEGAALDAACEKMASTIMQAARLPSAVLDQVASQFAGGCGLLAVRSSANVEDLAGMSAAGLYESKVGVPADEREAVSAAVAEVWASLYSRRAVLSRRAAGVKQSAACMAVLLMEMVSPDVSFVLHTARPRDSNKGVVLAELAPGQGETLAAGTRGTPWRLEISKHNMVVETLAFANFSRALIAAGVPAPSSLAPAPEHQQAVSASPAGAGRRYLSFEEQHGVKAKAGAAAAAGASTGQGNGLMEVEVDYGKQRLSTDNEFREMVGRQLARVGMLIEASYGGDPQDIEGGLVYDEVAEGGAGGGNGAAAAGGARATIYVVQTRPQH